MQRLFSMLSAARLWGGSKPDSLDTLERRIKTILPEEYQESSDTIEPVSMGSAALKYGSDGKVAWDDIWDTFCDLAMAGGPPHKGKLLEPASPEEIAAEPERYGQVVQEICRGIRMVTSLAVMPSPIPGWIRVDCGDPTTASWMTRAIVMENVSAHCNDTTFDLPAGPGYRIEKEVKNVITVMAKTGHYWLDHTSPKQQRTVADLFAKLQHEQPLIQPSPQHHDLDAMAQSLQASTGLKRSNLVYPGWLGLEIGNVRTAIWIMRALVASNVLARREDTVLFVPVNPETDPNAESVITLVTRIHNFATQLPNQNSA